MERLGRGVAGLRAFSPKLGDPAELRSERFGITHYHHPELLAALSELDPEEQLLTVIDARLFEHHDTNQWEGTADELAETLLEWTYDLRPPTGAIKRLLAWPGAAGVYLSSLARRYPDRIASKRPEQAPTPVDHQTAAG